MEVLLGVLVGFVTVGGRGVSDSFASAWKCFLHTQLLHPALISMCVPSLPIVAYTVFG